LVVGSNGFPDGETGERADWITWLEPIFAEHPAFAKSGEFFRIHATGTGRERYMLRAGIEPQAGRCSDFACFRDTISRHLGATDFPILMEHSDCDGQWSVAALQGLIMEFETIGAKFRTLPPEEPKAAFEHHAEYREGARSLYECFHNVDGENLFDALITLAREGIRARRPILFE
jgi:hypothetical protein